MAGHLPALPGCLLEVADEGVLLQGGHGSGKSRLALALLRRGHRLVADDVVQVQTDGGRLLGRAPELLRGRLLVPPLGVISVVAHFGQQALLPAARITMLMRLGEESSMTADPLEGGWFETHLAGISLPTLRLQANSCEDLATLTEAAAREGRERRHGRFAGRAFTTAQRQLTDRQEPCD